MATAYLAQDIKHDRQVAVKVLRPELATVVEASLMILGRFGEAGDPQLDRLLRTIGAEVVPVGEEQVALAAWRQSTSPTTSA